MNLKKLITTPPSWKDTHGLINIQLAARDGTQLSPLQPLWLIPLFPPHLYFQNHFANIPRELWDQIHHPLFFLPTSFLLYNTHLYVIDLTTMTWFLDFIFKYDFTMIINYILQCKYDFQPSLKIQINRCLGDKNRIRSILKYT